MTDDVTRPLKLMTLGAALLLGDVMTTAIGLGLWGVRLEMNAGGAALYSASGATGLFAVTGLKIALFIGTAEALRWIGLSPRAVRRYCLAVVAFGALVVGNNLLVLLLQNQGPLVSY